MIKDRDRRAPTATEREANKVFKTVRPTEAMTDYAKAQKAVHDNRERLKVERLAREAEAANRTKAG
ncbi:hypothetical protein GPL21_35715 [Bradyrhizobium pachyrhizi]|uniref:Uncharacterized protein n=1 Tax=Bradyrhizobium pachyrhizi TaxID=280333 RepID=A0A844SYH9_9BRAD|nr:hypothetical protein [Bradyrhizobium pachyrhizi]MVT70425.1 hypothetical protein [Bradyrhizobium pachyrhizi]WFU55108.1 hypothetical protein QA639_37070 [Bradyrhizobium pachyrhizi]